MTNLTNDLDLWEKQLTKAFATAKEASDRAASILQDVRDAIECERAARAVQGSKTVIYLLRAAVYAQAARNQSTDEIGHRVACELIRAAHAQLVSTDRKDAQ